MSGGPKSLSAFRVKFENSIILAGLIGLENFSLWAMWHSTYVLDKRKSNAENLD